MKEKLIKTVELKNNLTLELFDASKKIAGDRCLVSLISRIQIPINNYLFGEKDEKKPNIDDIIKELGEIVIFENKSDRNFVDEKEKDVIVNQLSDHVLINIMQYYSHINFGKNYILKKYYEQIEKKNWYKPCLNENLV